MKQAYVDENEWMKPENVDETSGWKKKVDETAVDQNYRTRKFTAFRPERSPKQQEVCSIFVVSLASFFSWKTPSPKFSTKRIELEPVLRNKLMSGRLSYGLFIFSLVKLEHSMWKKIEVRKVVTDYGILEFLWKRLSEMLIFSRCSRNKLSSNLLWYLFSGKKAYNVKYQRIPTSEYTKLKGYIEHRGWCIPTNSERTKLHGCVEQY